MQHLGLSIEQEIARAIEGLDLTETRRSYREQNEFVVLDRFLTRPAVEEFLREVDLLTPGVSRDDVSGYKKEGSVDFSALQNQAPAILSLYRSPALLTFLSRLVDAPPVALS